MNKLGLGIARNFATTGLGLVMSLLTALTPAADAFCDERRPALEYQIKASMLFNFLQFVTWPPEGATITPQTLNICVIGRDRFGAALEVLENEIVSGRHIMIQRFLSPESSEAMNCQVIFVNRSVGTGLENLLGQLRNVSVLTVGEDERFLEQGGMISLIKEGDRITFDINRQAVRSGRLDISSKLLRMARRVID